ncbi:unnamed protein product [Heligmosomoides polygyrus]|uniref:Hist_deacetyl domain-containing protein n=1 Tax=Heligmosomoides polygyrus TaxID=6339 RepID=A0A183G0N4_HELPZ|nr:unnamed protein product [Heligmosomoides polygyrus]
MARSGTLEYKTTIGFNVNQHLHYNTVCVDHPESPSRIDECRAMLQESGLLTECQVVEEFPALDELDLRQSHAESHVNKMLNGSTTQDQKALNKLCEDYDSVFMTPIVSIVALVSPGHLQIPNAFALVRPPGHHADRFSASGFCIFNNAAQAAEAAFNFGADRILIVDLDVHHGNGTQQIFYEDKRVLYFSIHRYETGSFWPHSRESNYDHIGEYEGKGYNVNVLLFWTSCGDADYMAIFWNVLWPLASQFRPDFVIVSAGFDSCEYDPLGGMQLSPDAYSHIVYHLSALAQGRVLCVLEGGYNHSVVAVGVHRCVRVLCGYKPFPLEILKRPRIRYSIFCMLDLTKVAAVRLEESKVWDYYNTVDNAAQFSTVESCLNCISALRGIWACFDFYNISGPWKDFEWSL